MSFRNKIAEAHHTDIPDNQFNQWIHGRYPRPAGNKCKCGTTDEQQQQCCKHDTGKQCFQSWKYECDNDTDNNDHDQLCKLGPWRLLNKRLVQYGPDRVRRKLTHGHGRIRGSAQWIHDTRGRGAHQNQFVFKHAGRNFIVDNIKIGKAAKRISRSFETDQHFRIQRSGHFHLRSQVDGGPQFSTDVLYGHIQKDRGHSQGVGGKIESIIFIKKPFTPGGAIHVVT